MADINKPLAVSADMFANEYGRVVSIEGQLWPALAHCAEYVVIEGGTLRSQIEHTWTRMEAERLHDILSQLLGRMH